MPRRFLTSTLALVLVTSALPAQNFEIAIKKGSVKGETQEIRETDSHACLNRFFDSGGVLLREEKPAAVKRVLEYTVTILDGGDKRPARYKETYTKAAFESGKKSVPLTFGGRSILYELKDGFYQAKAEGEPHLSDSDLAYLHKKANMREEANLDAPFLPGKGVKVGESWTVDAKKVVMAMGKDVGAEFDSDTAKVTVKLVRAYKKNGQQWGTLEMAVQASVKASGPWKLDPQGAFNFTLVIDTAIDASSSSGTMRMVSDLTAKAALERRGVKLTLDTKTDMTKEKTVIEK